MNLFVRKIIIFAIPLLLLAVTFEISLRNIPNNYAYKCEYIKSHSDEIETLILGSSHAYRGLNPDFFLSHTFNAGYVAQPLLCDKKILEKFQPRLQNLKTVILPISIFTLFGQMKTGDTAKRSKNYVIYYGLEPSTSITEYSEVLSNKISKNYKRFMSYYKKGKSNVSCLALGQEPISKSESEQELLESGKQRALLHTYKLDSPVNRKIFDENVKVLISILDLCQKNNITVYLFTSPGYVSYRENLNEEQLNLVVETVTNTCKKYDNCMYENLLGDRQYDVGDFYDGDHLSERGAEKLSKYINDKINDWK